MRFQNCLGRLHHRNVGILQAIVFKFLRIRDQLLHVDDDISAPAVVELDPNDWHFEYWRDHYTAKGVPFVVREQKKEDDYVR